MSRYAIVMLMAAGLAVLPLGCDGGDDGYGQEGAEERRSPLARAMEDAERQPPEHEHAAPAEDEATDEAAGEPEAAEDQAEAEPAEEAEEPRDEPVEGEPIVVEITGNDQMQFNRRAFEVRTGQPVRIVFQNVGQLPKVAMGHNLVILKKGVDMFDFGAASIEAGLDRDYIPEGREDEIFAHTPVLGPGEDATLEFTAPEPGEYPYICSFLGHFAAMNGQMIVTEE